MTKMPPCPTSHSRAPSPTALLERAAERVDHTLLRARLALAHRGVGAALAPGGGRARVGAYRVEYQDARSFLVEHRDIFTRRIYEFAPRSAAPVIIDAGACIGMATLFFKHRHPGARVLCLEPDPGCFAVLERNVRANGLDGVRLLNAAVVKRPGPVAFQPDGADGGRVAEGTPRPTTVQGVPLSSLIDGPVDFLKVNIEGMELPALEDLEETGALGQVREMVIEYHGWAGEAPRLGRLLELLERNGLVYLVHDFEADTCGATKPPFAWSPTVTWFCLVYARRP
ncbi:MAG TPA: FkbM family methyltransferase [Polyangia bacterium]|jgi:FkbM family methyltransferase